MKSLPAVILSPLRLLRRGLRASLPGRYLRALSTSARMSLALVAGLAVAILGLSAFSDPDVEVDSTPDALPVVARAAEFVSLAPEIHVFGRVENPNTTDLRASTLAYVSDVRVREGQTVGAGDVLLRLDDRDAQLAVQRAQAALSEAQGERDRVLAQQAAEVKNAANQRRLFELTVRKQERFRTLFSQGQVSATDFDALEQQRLEMEMALTQQEMLLASHDAQRASVEARVMRAEADWEEAKLNLERLTLLAPFDGTIIDIKAAIGARIDGGQTVMTLFDAQSQQVRVSLSENDAHQLRAAQDAQAKVLARARVADEWVELDLLEIGARVRAGRAGTDVLFAAPQDSRLALGRAVSVKITLPPQDHVLEVPLQGVYADRTVYTVHDGRLRAVEVERVGVREDADGGMSLLLRTDALAEGEPVVVSSLSRAGSGTRVRIIGSDQGRTGDDAATASAAAVARL
ncbi:MAG: HlyD family efflux transporter periplasmic adaptor subunit [Halieaceae bacterium]|jgi:RND family efflux transporter MFP subunit|nr:HlyD family efflux transporter periplasmic adaptor subunit [Halieaceae bacterium]